MRCDCTIKFSLILVIIQYIFCNLIFPNTSSSGANRISQLMLFLWFKIHHGCLHVNSNLDFQLACQPSYSWPQPLELGKTRYGHVMV